MFIFNSGRMQQIAARMITDAGSLVKLKHNAAGAYNPATGSATTTSTEYDFQLAQFNYVLRPSGQDSIPNSLVQQDDKKLYVLPRADAPVPTVENWQVNLDGRWWNIVNIKTVAPAGIAIYHEIQVRIK